MCVVGEKTLIVEEVLMVQQLSGGERKRGRHRGDEREKTKESVSLALAFLLHLVSAGSAGHVIKNS